MALNSLICADVPLRNCSLTVTQHTQITCFVVATKKVCSTQLLTHREYSRTTSIRSNSYCCSWCQWCTWRQRCSWRLTPCA